MCVIPLLQWLVKRGGRQEVTRSNAEFSAYLGVSSAKNSAFPNSARLPAITVVTTINAAPSARGVIFSPKRTADAIIVRNGCSS